LIMRPMLLFAALAAGISPCLGQDAFSDSRGPADAAVRLARSLDSTASQETRVLTIADRTESAPGRPGGAGLRVQIEQGSRFLPVPNLVFSAFLGGKQITAVSDRSGLASFDGCAPGEDVQAQAWLTDESFAIRPAMARLVSAQVSCGSEATLSFNRFNPGIGALRVWRVATSAKAKLDAAVGPSAWPRGASFFLNGGAATHGIQVGVGADDTTFVIGHELGHAVSDHAGMIQQGFGDSFHLMTACVGDSGALEEGWASFFGAWVDQGDSSDPIQEWDQHSWAKRRIPIKTIPDEVEVGPLNAPQTARVCVGTDNEMRVMSFFWNVVSSPDVGAPFPVLWKALAGKNLRSVSAVALNLRALGADETALRRAWAAAFKTPCPF
jgi:hypothetical protein